MLWFHLYFNNTHPEHLRLLLFECRSNRNFYKHQAYTYVRDYAGIMRGILEDGIKEKAFREDVNVYLARDVIFGLLDLENLDYVTSSGSREPVPDFEDILNLIIPMLASKAMKSDGQLDKPTRILLAAESVFAEKGYIEATINEIARSSNVSEGTIYEYFKNKEDLLFSIPERRFKEHIEALDEVFEIKTPIKRLRRLIRYHFYLYLTDRNFLKVFLLHIQLNQKFYESHVYRAFQKYTQIITNTLEEGKKDGSIRADVNTRVFRNLFLGTFSHLALRWLILEKEAEIDKMKEIDEIVVLLSRSVTCNPEWPAVTVAE